MKKVDLLNLIQNIADDGDINETILGTDEFKDLGKVDLSKLTTEEFKNLLESNDIAKGYMTSHDDSVRSTAVETFKNGKMKDIVQKAIDDSKNESKTPEQIALDEVKAELAKMKEEKQKAEMIAKYQGVLTDKKIPTKAIGLILGNDEESTDTKITLLEEIIQPLVDEKVMERLGVSSYEPPEGGGTPKINNPWAKETFNLTQQAKILKENPELANKLKAMAGK